MPKLIQVQVHAAVRYCVMLLSLPALIHGQNTSHIHVAYGIDRSVTTPSNRRCRPEPLFHRLRLSRLCHM
jgi:hypothetical protein